MSQTMKSLKGFIIRMILFAVTLTLLIVGSGWAINGEFSLLNLFENFIYVSCATLFCSVFLRLLYDWIFQFSRLLFFILFSMISSFGIVMGLIVGTMIMEGRLFVTVNFLFAILIGLVSSVGVTFYEVQKSWLEENISRLRAAELENAQLQRIESEARLSSLQARLNPHFLFNTLNATAALIYDDPQKAEQSIVQLSDIYRKVLSISNKTFISLAEEIALIQNILKLERLRFEDRLTFHIACPESILRMPVPGLIIEPIVENCIQHAEERSEIPLHIDIHITEQDGWIHVRVKDNGPGFDVGKTDFGFGLYSVQERLRLLFREDFQFNVQSAQNEGTLVEIGFPSNSGPNEAKPSVSG